MTISESNIRRSRSSKTRKHVRWLLEIRYVSAGISLNFEASSALNTGPKFQTIMNLSSFRAFLILICSIGLISYVIAGSGASGDHGRPTTGPGGGGGNG